MPSAYAGEAAASAPSLRLPEHLAGVLVDREQLAVVVEQVQALAADHGRELEQHVALVLPELLERRPRRVLQRQVAAAVARVAVVRPDEAVDLGGLLLAGLVGLQLGLGRGGRLVAELDVRVGDVALLAGDHERRGGAHHGQQRDPEAEHDPPQAPLALLRWHAPLGYRRAFRAPGTAPRAARGGARARGAGRRAARLGRRRGRPRPAARRRGPSELDLVVEGDALAGRAPRGASGSAARCWCTSASAPRRCAADGAVVRPRRRAARDLPAAGRAARSSSSARRSRRTSRGATSRSTRSRCGWPTASCGACPARAGGPRRARCCACSTTPRSATTRRGCCGSRATRAGSASRSSRTPRRSRAWPARSARSGRSAASGSGAELRLLAGEPQPAALAALDAHGAGAAAAAGLPLDTALVRARAGALPGRRAPRAGRARLRGPRRARGRARRAAARARLPRGRGGGAGRLRRAGPAAGGAPRRAPVGRPTRCCATGRSRRRCWRRPPARRPARDWLERGRHLRAAIGGDDLLAAGLTGPAIGRGLLAARAALLDGEAPDREAQLAAALAAARG